MSIGSALNSSARSGFRASRIDLARLLAATYGIFSLRRVRKAYTGPLINLRSNGSGTPTRDFYPLPDDSFPVTDALSWMAATGGTSLSVPIWYDQSPAAVNVSQATAASQPLFAAASLNSRPSIAFNNHLLTASPAGHAQPVTFSMVAVRTGRLTSFNIVLNNLSAGIASAGYNNATNATWQNAGGGTINATASDNAWHKLLFLFNGASSLTSVDGVETTGSVGTSGASSTFRVGQDASGDYFIGNLTELIMLTGAPPLSMRTLLLANQRTYYGV